MDGVAYLIQKAHTEDALGQRIPAGENQVEIFVTRDSVSRREWADAGRNGYNPEMMLTTAAINYSNEAEILYDGVRYAIYRTYTPPDSDEIELYLQKKAGVQNGGS